MDSTVFLSDNSLYVKLLTDFSVTDFSIGIEGKTELIQQGYQQTHEWFSKKHSYKIPLTPPNHKKRHRKEKKNSLDLIYYKWKSISYQYLLNNFHQ